MVMPKTSIEVRAHENFLRRSWEFLGILPKLPNLPLPNLTVRYLLIFDTLVIELSAHKCVTRIEQEYYKQSLVLSTLASV